MSTFIRVILKIGLIIIAFLIMGFLQILLKGGDPSEPGVGGPIGIVLLFAFFAGARAIWRYQPSEKMEDSSIDKHLLDKS